MFRFTDMVDDQRDERNSLNKNVNDKNMQKKRLI